MTGFCKQLDKQQNATLYLSFLNALNQSKMESVLIFDGTSYFVEQAEYTLGEGEEVVFEGTFEECTEKEEELSAYL